MGKIPNNGRSVNGRKPPPPPSHRSKGNMSSSGGCAVAAVALGAGLLGTLGAIAYGAIELGKAIL